jgi:hypothetical protein
VVNRITVAGSGTAVGLKSYRAVSIANPAGFPAGRRRVKVAIPLPLISVLKITDPGSSRGWTFIVPTMSKGTVKVIGSVEKGMTTLGQ